jgi:hypothetical protein
LQLSVTITPTGKVPVAAGVPLITPVVAMLKPVGRLPELTDHTYGAVPPAALRAALYVIAAVAVGKAFETMANGVDATVKLTVAVAVCCGLPRSVTVTPSVKLPFTVGVPEITPVHADRLNPAGRLPDVIDHRKLGVPPAATSVCE